MKEKKYCLIIINMAMQDKYSVFGDVLKLMVMSGIQYHDNFEVMKVRYKLYCQLIPN